MADTVTKPRPSRLTAVQWVICAVAALGFAFDTYHILVLPLIVGPALLELGKRRENPEHQPPAGGRGVDIGTLSGQDAKANPAFHQIMDGVDEVTEVAAEAIELPDDESITLAQCLEAGLQTGDRSSFSPDALSS